MSGIGPVLCFLSHQDSAQQQWPPDKVYEKAVKEPESFQRKLSAVPSHQNIASGETRDLPQSARLCGWDLAGQGV